jgi:hypothetical protein
MSDNLWITWYPAFRANKEVADVVAGHDPFVVLLASLRVKAWASLGAMIYALILPYFINLSTVSNTDGFLTVIVIAFICISIGIRDWNK